MGKGEATGGPLKIACRVSHRCGNGSASAPASSSGTNGTIIRKGPDRRSSPTGYVRGAEMVDGGFSPGAEHGRERSGSLPRHQQRVLSSLSEATGVEGVIWGVCLSYVSVMVDFASQCRSRIRFGMASRSL